MVIRFLLSDDFERITGQLINAHGGVGVFMSWRVHVVRALAGAARRRTAGASGDDAADRAGVRRAPRR